MSYTEQTPRLTDSDRASVRYHLENLFNEVDLLIKNQKINRADVKRQERDFADLKIYERIPFQGDLAGLKETLTQSAEKFQLKVKDFKLVRFSGPGKPIPQWIYTDQSEFHLSEDQLVELIYFQLKTTGTLKMITQWTQSWPNHQMRLTELDGGLSIKPIQKGNEKLWIIRGHAFRFRKIQFPTLVPRNPKDLLPPWARIDPETFSKSEPFLWNFVKKIQILVPKTRSCYENLEQFSLNDARMTFFLSKFKTH